MSSNDLNSTDELARFNEELLLLSKDERIDSGDLDSAFQSLTETLGRALKVARASIWLYNENRSSIICQDLAERDQEAGPVVHTRGTELFARDFPAYFSFLNEERCLSAGDALSDSATHEFAEVYLKPVGITSMLDAPIRLDGKMIGVICTEHVGPKRSWTAGEANFVASVSDVLARAFQAHQRMLARKQLETMNNDLENLVKRRTEELQTLNAKTIQSAKLAALGEMAGGIAHEINTPLSLILLLAEQIGELSHSPESLKRAQESAVKIGDTVLRISKIIKSLKTFSRDGSNAAMENCDLIEIADETLLLCTQRMKQSSIRFEFIKPEGVCTRAMCQPIQISQVMLNLLNNAFDAVKEQPEPWVRLELHSDDHHVSFAVSNSGPPIPADLRDKLFQPFFTTKPIGEGTGLGLSISKGIVDKHHGSLSLDLTSTHTKFVVSLPCDPNARPQAAA